MAVVVITGGARGIGLGVAERCAADGWTVVVADLPSDEGPAAVERVGGDFVAVDVTDAEALRDAFAAVAERHGAIEGLVTCAGITIVGASESLAADDWRRVLDIDLTGTFLSCQAAVTHMPSGAAIVTIASVAALRGIPERAAYAAAKAGVVGLTRTLGAEWAQRGVRVNAVGPGWVDTPFLRDAAAHGHVDLAELAGRPPMRRLAQVGDVVGTIAFLLGPDSAYITGQTLYVDGGWTWGL